MFSRLFLLPLTTLNLVFAYTPLSDSFLRHVPSGATDFDIATGSLLAPLLIPRVPGTPGHALAQEHFAQFFASQLPSWTLTWQNSTYPVRTPSSKQQIEFSNLIFKKEPPWTVPGQANFLTLVAHYDSRAKPEGFVGATDSAVSCAILMHVARSIDGYMTKMHKEMQELGEGGEVEMDMGIQILFLDGREGLSGDEKGEEELFGSRALARTWDTSPNTVLSPYPSTLSQISLFVLLDLLGSSNPRIPSYSSTTHWIYKHLASIETRMRSLGVLETKPPSPFFSETRSSAEEDAYQTKRDVPDDHIAFLDRGVPTLHLIPESLTPVWRTIEDDGKHLDVLAVRDWGRIMTAFTLEFLDMMEVWPEE